MLLGKGQGSKQVFVLRASFGATKGQPWGKGLALRHVLKPRVRFEAGFLTKGQLWGYQGPALGQRASFEAGFGVYVTHTHIYGVSAGYICILSSITPVKRIRIPLIHSK